MNYIMWFQGTKQMTTDVLALIDKHGNRRESLPGCVSAQKTKACSLENGKDCEAFGFSRNATVRETVVLTIIEHCIYSADIQKPV